MVKVACLPTNAKFTLRTQHNHQFSDFFLKNRKITLRTQHGNQFSNFSFLEKLRKLMIVLGAKGDFCVFLDQAADRVGCESWVRKLCAKVVCGRGCEKKKSLSTCVNSLYQRLIDRK